MMENSSIHENILVVEDDQTFGALIENFLATGNYNVTWVITAQQALKCLENNHYSAILLDLHLPDATGDEVLEQIRKDLALDTPIIILTSTDDDLTIVDSLDNGADDYLVKPISKAHLLARVRTALRHHQLPAKNQLSFANDIVMDLNELKVTREGSHVHLTQSEFKLLKRLAEHPNQAYSRIELAEHLAESGDKIDSNLIDVHVHSLRKKLASKTVIETVRGVGYRFGSQ